MTDREKAEELRTECGGNMCMGQKVDGVKQWVSRDAYDALETKRALELEKYRRHVNGCRYVMRAAKAVKISGGSDIHFRASLSAYEETYGGLEPLPEAAKEGQ